MASTPTAIERLQMSVVDGRAENVRHRQDQLQSLHKVLREEAKQICAALEADSEFTTSEVEAEYCLAVEAVRQCYETLDFEKSLEKEYSVVHGKDNPRRRLGAGLVVILPTTYTRLYSLVTALAPAIASGNCVALPDTLLQTDNILRALLSQALNVDTFCIVKSIPDESVLNEAILVNQTSDGPSTTLTSHLLSSNSSRCIAVVDRSADLNAAAKAITTARFSFGGSSPYAPDLVLVNEFIRKDFFEACSQCATSYFAQVRGMARLSNDRNGETTKALEIAESEGQISSFGSTNFKLSEVLDQNTPLMKMKITGRFLLIATCSSLTDAAFNHDHENPLLSGYFFAEPASAKYLAQFIPCHISLVNRIPAHVLVGPAAPTAHAPDFLYRYNRDMFSTLRPQFVEKPPPFFEKIDGMIFGGAGDGAKKRGKTTTSAVMDMALKPLRPTGQPDNKAVGFFEVGFLTGAGIYLSMILPVLGYSTYYLSRKGLAYVMRSR
ncbi:hypothetical protein M406DRAFT_34412 [Cryphonectria parasitica EP155]|uniref:Aldehyde dehydrogenase domain-containing protein n=1 Tax=Cryphonectria parasitica (strain ATCC 38755 / EP155) TaxID=660469 RepID=A0A9P5CVI9_CRYP1|nr:uncharacterized protein M406DRAFT_34412 [Cryphonectria parasitica EP155]KAF3770720.1 hypothetical protein M406DRAFT_34412 [Cryphonectria parasitica EP155]